MKNTKFNKSMMIRIVVVLIVFVCACIFLKVFSKSLSYDWRVHTSPLTEKIKQDICQTLGLSKLHPFCLPNFIVYGPDFFPIIRAIIEPTSGKKMTYQEVEALIGKYKFYESPITLLVDGTSYFLCRYDLRGDQKFSLSIRFDSEGRIIEIYESLGDSQDTN